MTTVFFRSAVAGLALWASAATAEPQHGIAMYGDPALPPDFVALPYANPDAPTGGAIISAEVGTFDSLNPYVLKGTVPWQLTYLTTESLMGRSLDEPFTLYGLLAESVETAPDRSWVEFTLRPEARFSDGSPVTVEDVIWSYETLGTQGHPRYLTFWEKWRASKRPANGRSASPSTPLTANSRCLRAFARFSRNPNGKASISPTATGSTSSPSRPAPMSSKASRPAALSNWCATPTTGAPTCPSGVATNVIDTIRMEFFGDENRRLRGVQDRRNQYRA